MDNVNSPTHYTSHPSGVECIQITEHYNFTIGNSIKYLWRCGLKSEEGLDDKEKQIQDLEKAIWYINREINNLKTGAYDGKTRTEQDESVAESGGREDACYELGERIGGFRPIRETYGRGSTELSCDDYGIPTRDFDGTSRTYPGY